MTNGERLSEIERLNQEGARQVQEQAERIRAEVISMAYEVVRIHLDADKNAFEKLEEADFPDTMRDERFVIEDMRAAPLKNGDFPQTTLSVLFAPRVLNIENEFLRVHIPVPDITELGDYELPGPEEVDCVYLEYIRPGQDLPRRYAVKKEYMYEYVSAADAGEDDLSTTVEDIIFKSINRARIDDDAAKLALKAQIDIVEMAVIPQAVNGEKFIDHLRG